MRITFAAIPVFLFAFSPLAQGQYYGQPQPMQQHGDQTILYDMKKNQPPSAVVIEQGNMQPGIPTSGVQQQQKLTPKSTYGSGGPTFIRKDKGVTVITGPDGTTVCRDISGRTVMCY